jgi:hypothetical protein
LSSFLSLIAAERLMGVFDAAPTEQPKETRRAKNHEANVTAYERAAALQDVLDGNLGDPIAVARGELNMPTQARGENAELFPSDHAEQASLFSGSSLDPRHVRLAHELVEEARSLAQRHRFLHWELAFPNVWQNWLSAEPRGGFDAVIGNPPYVRQEHIKDLKPALNKAYRTYNGMADLYVYFYELGLRLLRPGGRLSYVVTNKWLRAGYAEELRDLLSSEGWLEAATDFGHAKKFFPGADVFPCVIVARRPDGSAPPDVTEVCQISREVVRLDRVSQQVSEMGFPLPRASFTKQGWQLDPPEVAALMDKIHRAGIPLKECTGASPQYGIKTGCNEAFLIDTPTRDALVADDPGCVEIIRPYLRGEDIERWFAPWRGLWMIVLKSSANKDWPWSNDPNNAEEVFARTHPSLYAYLRPLKSQLMNRQDKGRFWWELRSCSYYDKFEMPKIMYQEIQFHPAFAFDRCGSFANNKVFFICDADDCFAAILNSPLLWWYNWRYLTHLKDEALSPQAYRMERLPIAKPADELRAKCLEGVRSLISIKEKYFRSSLLLSNWYVAELSIAKPRRILREPFILSREQFTEEIRKSRGPRAPLSAATVQAIHEEYARTVQPIHGALRQAARFERQLGDLVNQAYGLTPDEVRLMWDTAPPRMPLTREAEGHSQGDVEAVA